MRTFFALLCATHILAGAAASSASAAPVERAAICGIGDTLFCGPLDSVARDAKAPTSYWWTWAATADAIAARKPRRVDLIGHSQGCNSALLIAWRLQAQRISVRRLVCFDGAPFLPAIPSNVVRAASWRKPFVPGGATLCDSGRVPCRETTFRFGTVTHMSVPLAAKAAALAFLK